MTATCSCPPGDCHGGHTINVGMPVTSAQFCGYGSCDRPPGHEGPHLCRCSKPVDSPANGCKWHTPGARLTDEQLRQLRDDPLADYHHAGITAMATELLALRARAAELEAAQPYREVWSDECPPGGMVCSICGVPVESEPCPKHAPREKPAERESIGYAALVQANGSTQVIPMDLTRGMAKRCADWHNEISPNVARVVELLETDQLGRPA